MRCIGMLLLVAMTAALQAESVHREVLPSGLVLVVHEFHQTPTAEIRVAVRAGPLSEGPMLGSGASVLLQRVLVNSGVGGQSVEDVRRAIARLGNRFYAETTVATAVYGVSTTGDQVGDGLALCAALLSNYQYTQADLQREREAILAQPAPSPAVLGDLLLAGILYRQHPARLPVTGTPAMLEQVTLDLLRRYQAARYTAANTVVTVVGNVNTDEVRRQAAQAFARYAIGGFQPMPPIGEPPQVGPRHASGVADVAQPQVAIAWRTESAEHPAQPALAVLAQVLSAQVMESGLPAGITIHSENRAPIEQPGALVVRFSADPAVRADGERAVYAAVEALAKDGPSVEALAAAKRYLRRMAAERQETARQRAEELERWELATGDPGFGATQAAAIAAVTSEDVAKVARRYCGDGGARACTVEVRAGGDSAPEPGKAAEPTSSVAPSVLDLGRGLRLIAHPPADVPLVHLRLSIGHVLAAEEPELSGSAAALAALLPRGAGPRSAADLAALARSGVLQVDTQCDHDGLALTITALAEDLAPALEVLADLLTRPTLAAEDLDAVRGALLRRIDLRTDDARSQLLATLRSIVWAGDPAARHAHGVKEVVARLDRGAVVGLWQRVAVGGNVVVSIAGNYDRNAVVSALTALLAARPPVAEGSLTLPPPPAPASVPPLSVVYRDVPVSSVALAWRLPSRSAASDDDAPLAVIAALLSGIEVPGGRINRALAQLPGMPTLTARSELDAHHGLWILHGDADAAALDAVPQVAREQVAQLLAQLDLPDSDPRALSAAELATAKQMCLTAHALSQEDAGAQVHRAAAAVLAGVDPGREAGFPARIAAVSTADLARVAKAWLAADPVIVVAKPRAREGSASRTDVPAEGGP